MNVHKTNFGSTVGLDINLNLKRNELFTPPPHDKRQPDGSKLEFWFIIDCSGSMGWPSGGAINSAKQALKVLTISYITRVNKERTADLPIYRFLSKIYPLVVHSI